MLHIHFLLTSKGSVHNHAQYFEQYLGCKCVHLLVDASQISQMLT